MNNIVVGASRMEKRRFAVQFDRAFSDVIRQGMREANGPADVRALITGATDALARFAWDQRSEDATPEEVAEAIYHRVLETIQNPEH